MLTNIRDGGDLAVVAKNCDPLPRERYDGRALLGYMIHSADFYESFFYHLMSRPIQPVLTERRGEMDRENCGHSRDEDGAQYGTRL
jgi:hypothetical protein